MQTKSVGFSKPYWPELDALRFWAFASVFFSHFGRRYLAGDESSLSCLVQIKNAAVWTGSLGVDLFFCLSAFLITTLLLKECDAKGTFDLKRFYIRRCLRILPLYLVVVVIFCYIVRFEPIDGRTKLLFTTVFLGNLPYMLWDKAPQCIGHLWSVAVEMQFYLVWAIILKLKPKRAGLPGICAAIVAVSAVAKVVVAIHRRNMWMNTFTRLDGIAAGIILADLVYRCGWSPTKVKRICLAVVGLFVPFCCVLTMKHEGSNGLLSLVFYPAVAVACACLIGSVYGQEYVRVPGWMAYLGKISYGLYVFHAPVTYLFDTRSGSLGHIASSGRVIPTVAAFCGISAVTIAISAISYEYFEKRMFAWKDGRFGAGGSRRESRLRSIAAS